MTPSRYVIGIDLGTTNTTLSYVDTDAIENEMVHIPVHEFAMPQVVAPGSVEPRSTLPSALYVAGGELPPDSLHLSWRAEEHQAIGHFAREQGSRVPSRLIASSKSWLCHGGVNREDRILPWMSPEEDAKRSPAEVATLILRHLREAWDANIASEDDSLSFARQDLVLCIPASFDAVARNLTAQAAKDAGLESISLLEEPQAAFYSWIETTGNAWRKKVHVGDLILVVDVGGGTTDFSLIAVTEEEGELSLRRVAVGEHILLGGDNMDLALAYGLAERLAKEKNIKLAGSQILALTQQCRAAKEAMLSDPKLKEVPITLLGKGASLVGGAVKTELKRKGLDEFLLNGFFPDCALTDRPVTRRRAGLAEAGLPYAQDAAVTRHLAKFLSLQGSVAQEIADVETTAEGAVLPTAVLFNGGVFRADLLRERVLSVLSSWCEAAGREAPRELEGTDLDLAVSRGAAYYGIARRGRGVRIRGGSARSYYVGFEAPMPAVPGFEPPVKLLCVVPYGMKAPPPTSPASPST